MKHYTLLLLICGPLAAKIKDMYCGVVALKSMQAIPECKIPYNGKLHPFTTLVFILLILKRVHRLSYD